MIRNKITRRLFVALFVLSNLLIISSPDFTAQPTTATGNDQLISSAMLSRPTASGNYIFWVDSRSTTGIPVPGTSVRGYNLLTSQEFVIKDSANQKFFPSTDGEYLAWIERSDTNSYSIEGYDLNSGTLFNVLPVSSTMYISLALDGGLLYYHSDRGLSYLKMADPSGGTQLISDKGQYPVAGGGQVLWIKETQTCSSTGSSSGGPRCHSRWNLFRLNGQLFLANQPIPLPGSIEPLIHVVTGWGDPFDGYHVSGNYVVWARQGHQPYLHTISTGISQPISVAPAARPVTNGLKVAWTVKPGEAIGQTGSWKLQVYNILTGVTSDLVANSNANVYAWDTVGQVGQEKAVYTVEKDKSTKEVDLLVADLTATGLSYPNASPLNPNACIGRPTECGQIYSQSNYLWDDDGPWFAGGVQYIHPDLGINSQSFYNNPYNSSTHIMDCWLDVATGHPDPAFNCADPNLYARRGFLNSNIVRIFVEMGSIPGDAPTSPQTIADFLRHANTRHMRVGISFWSSYNNGNIALSAANREWLRQVFTHIRGQNPNLLPVIAYVNAENEINQGCEGVENGDPRDCFDYDWVYIDDANKYVQDFRAAIDTYAPGLITTVGMSTEMTEADDAFAEMNFFRQCDRNQHPECAFGAPAIANSVHFLSPHNYGGGGPPHI